MEIFLQGWNKHVDIKISAHDTFLWKEEFEDTKGVTRIRKSKKDIQHNGQKKKDRQYNGQKKKDKRTNNDLQNIHIILKIE